MAVAQDAGLTPAGKRVLDAAAELFYERGITAVGVDLIARRAGVTKKTLYDRFGSKDELIAAYLRERDRRWRTWLAAEADRVADQADPRERILVTFDAMRTWALRESPRGCSFVNAAAELPDGAHPARQVIAGQKQWLYDHLLQMCRELPADDPGALADRLMLVHEGANVLVGLRIVDDPAGIAVRMVADLLAA